MNNVESIRQYCLSKPMVTESLPFDNVTLVFKVDGKIFALLNLEGAQSVNLKCNPERAIELREQYSEVQPGFHMNKKHWNTVTYNGRLANNLICEMIDASYMLVVEGLSKEKQKAILIMMSK